MLQLTFNDYENFRNLIQDRVGLYFDERKQHDLSLHLMAALKEAGIADPSTYYTRLKGERLDGSLWMTLVKRLTIGETYFFRDAAQFRALRERILPDLIQKRRKDGYPIIRIWSAGCATGEEPYSIAMLLRELIPDIDAWNISILATDINRESLEVAGRGIYRDHSFRKDTPSHLTKLYFQPTQQGFEVLPRIKRMVSFAYLNLAEACYPSGSNFTSALDMIICRNVTIYFNQATTKEIARRFHSALLPGGWLIVGHSEPQAATYDNFAVRNFEGAVVYQKPIETHFAEKPAPVVETPPLAVPPPPPAVVEREISFERAVIEEARQERVDAIGCYEMGKKFADQMQWPEAHQWLTRALAYNPLLIEAHFTRAMVYMHEGDDAAALQALQRALYIDRNFVMGHFNFGLIHWRLGNNHEAQRAWSITQDLLKKVAAHEILPYSDGVQAGYITSLLKTYLATEATVKK